MSDLRQRSSPPAGRRGSGAPRSAGPRPVAARRPVDSPRRSLRPPHPAGSGPLPRIDPRFARRWIEARRQEGRRRLRILVAVLAVVSCGGLALGSLYSPLFAVRHVRVRAGGGVPASAVVAAAGLQHHPLMIDVDSARVAARLDADPLLGGARVSRHWPSTIDITVVVRSPVAAVPAGGGFAEVDATGRVLTRSAGRPRGLPLLNGAGTPPAPGGWLPGSPGPGAVPPVGSGPHIDASSGPPGSGTALVGAALAFLGSVPAVLRPAIESATIPPGSSGHGVTLTVVPPRDPSETLQVYLGDGSALPAKVASFVTMLDEANLSGVSAIDLTVPYRPVTQPAGA